MKSSFTTDKLEDVKALIDGQSITVRLEPFTVMNNLKTNATSFWNLAFMTGFLTVFPRATTATEFEPTRAMRIPNKEVLYFFETTVLEWFNRSGNTQFLTDFLNALITGYVERFLL